MEEEAREILREATKDEGKKRRGLGTRISDLFVGIGLKPGEELPKLPVVYLEPPDFKE